MNPFNLGSCLAYDTWVLNLSCASCLVPWTLSKVTIRHHPACFQFHQGYFLPLYADRFHMTARD